MCWSIGYVSPAGTLLQPSSVKDPPGGTDPTKTTTSGPDHQQPQTHIGSKADAGLDQKPSQYEAAEDHKSVVAPSAESIRQGIMEARSCCENALPLQPFVSLWEDTVSSTHVRVWRCHDSVQIILQSCPCCMHESRMAGSGVHPVHRIWLYAVLRYAMYAVCTVSMLCRRLNLVSMAWCMTTLSPSPPSTASGPLF